MISALLLFPAIWAAPIARPNILFVYTDDQRYDAFGVVQREQGPRARFPWFQTPQMDRLARDGVRFRNAFVVNSLCAPSRAVNLTGRYSHLNGIASNFRSFPLDNVTHASLLRQAGYTTAYIGKWHMGNQRERPGFDYHASYLGHARYVDPPLVVQGVDVPGTGWIDDISTDYAVEFLRRQQQSPKPWLLVVGFKSPHGPFEPPPRAKDRFAGEIARDVPNMDSRAIYLPPETGGKKPNPPARPRPAHLDYFRCISAADDCLGRLLDALDELGYAENTLVVYTSDNGFYLGEHSLGDKRSAYDESLRVPFVVRYPRLDAAARGKVVDAMVLNLDLAPTLLEAAGLPPPPAMQGRSWLPLLTNPATPWRQSWFYEYFAEKQRNTRVPDITAVRTATAKLICYPDHPQWTELFDLAADPYETRNLVADPRAAGLRATLEAELTRLKTEVGYRVPDYVDRPTWWGKPDGPETRPSATPQTRLDVDFAQPGDGQPVDRAVNHRLKLVGGKWTAAGLRLDGRSYVEVPNTPDLNPAQRAWSVEATVQPEKPDGTVLARGGRGRGYALWLKDGRPRFTVVVEGEAVTAIWPRAVSGTVRLLGTITANRQLSLAVDGEPAVQTPLAEFIDADPHDTMQIGADRGSPVVVPEVGGFVGVMMRVRLSSGEAGR